MSFLSSRKVIRGVTRLDGAQGKK